MNHGFTVDSQTLPAGVRETHVIACLMASNCGIAVDGKPVFSVQYHPEASPGPQDSYYLFRALCRSNEAPAARPDCRTCRIYAAINRLLRSSLTPL